MIGIRKELTVEAPLDRAFRVFTANMGAWWLITSAGPRSRTA